MPCVYWIVHCIAKPVGRARSHIVVRRGVVDTPNVFCCMIHVSHKLHRFMFSVVSHIHVVPVCVVPVRVAQAFSADPLRDAVLHEGRKKRRRYDEDYVRVVCERASVGQASSGSVARVLGVVSKSTAYEWNGLRDIPAYVAATWLSVADKMVLGVSFDGKRLGSPKEETVTYAIADGHFGGWLPPMVPRPARYHHMCCMRDR